MWTFMSDGTLSKGQIPWVSDSGTTPCKDVCRIINKTKSTNIKDTVIYLDIYLIYLICLI
jgi:hypothetical protein